MAKRKPAKRFKVYSEIDRGENSKPRYAGGYCMLWPVTRQQAEEIAEQERRKPYVSKVEIRETR
jgi:hypothetical protein